MFVFKCCLLYLLNIIFLHLILRDKNCSIIGKKGVGADRNLNFNKGQQFNRKTIPSTLIG